MKINVLFSVFFSVFFVNHAYAENIDRSKFYELSSELKLEKVYKKLSQGTGQQKSSGLIVKFGRFNLPFIENPSSSNSEALKDYYESNKEAALFQHAWNTQLLLSAYVFNSLIKDVKIKWGARAVYTNEQDTLKIGLSYISDLAEANVIAMQLKDSGQHKRAAGLAAFALYEADVWGFSAEYIESADSSAPLANVSSWFAELNYKLIGSWLIAAKVARNKQTNELADREYGLSLAYSVNNNFSLSFDYIDAVYKDAQSINSKKVIGAIKYQF